MTLPRGLSATGILRLCSAQRPTLVPEGNATSLVALYQAQDVLGAAVVSTLRVCKTLVAIPAVEVGIAGRLPVTRRRKRTRRVRSTRSTISWQHLGIDLGVFRHGLLDAGRFCRWLLVGMVIHTVSLPGLPTFTSCGMVDMAAEHQGTITPTTPAQRWA